MKLVVDADGAVALVEPEDLKRFKLELTDPTMPPERLEAALSGIGSLDRHDTAWIREASLRRMGESAGCGPDWQEALGGMIGFASKHGWINATGDIRVHIERATPA